MAVVLGLSAAPAWAQVFLAASPPPDFAIGPLIVQAIVPQDLGTVSTGGTVLTAHRRFGVGWLATVSHREVEQHEVVVEIEIEDNVVRGVEWRVGRSRAR